MKYRLPLACIASLKPTITQPYGDKTNVAWYQANGLNLTEHNGLDLVVGDPMMTYGTRIVCPVPKAELSKSWFENPMSTSGNGIQIAWEEGVDRYNMRCWHCSDLVLNARYVEGDTIAFIGNSGLVRPAPTPQKPFDGSHLHLMVFKNGKLIDPLDVFDANRWFVSMTDTGVEKDTPPIAWALAFVRKQVERLKLLIG